MGFMDKLLGRSKKAAGDVTGDSSMRSEGMHQEQQAMAAMDQKGICPCCAFSSH